MSPAPRESDVSGLGSRSAAPISPPRSIRIVASEAHECRAGENVEVEERRPMIDVVEVVFDAASHLFGCVGLSAKAVDLRPPRDSGLYPMAAEIAVDQLDVMLVMGDRMRPRADQRHGSRKDVQELRQFVEAAAPQKSADPRHPRIVAPGLRHVVFARRRRAHRAELVYHEAILVEAEALLAEQHRTGAIQLHQGRNHYEERSEEDQQQTGDGYVHATLDEHRPPRQRTLEHGNRRQQQPHALGSLAYRDMRAQFDVDRHRAEPCERGAEFVALRAWHGNGDLVDPLATREAKEIADAGSPPGPLRRAGGHLGQVEDADDAAVAAAAPFQMLSQEIGGSIFADD